MDGAWPNAPSLEIDSWFLEILIFHEKMMMMIFLLKMNEAWSNAPNSTINVNFEKFYCVGTSIKQNLSKTISKPQNWAKQGLLGGWANGLWRSVNWHIETEDWWWLLSRCKIHVHLLQKILSMSLLVISYYKNVLG